MILFGKYKNKKGIIVRFYNDDRGIPTAEVEPIPKGRKKNRQIGLFKFWHADMEKRSSTRRAAQLIQFPEQAPRKARHSIAIGGDKYALSDDGGDFMAIPKGESQEGFGARVIRGPSTQPPFRYLWAYDIERGMVEMWRVTDGNNRASGKADSFRTKLVQLDRQGELNRVTTGEMRVIGRAMRKKDDEHSRMLEQWAKEHEGDYQKFVNQVAAEVFEKEITPAIERRLRELERGVYPFGFQVIESILEHEDEQAQMRGHVISEETARFTDDMVEDEVRRRGVDPDAKTHDIQAAHWAVQELTTEAWRRFKRASPTRVVTRHQGRIACKLLPVTHILHNMREIAKQAVLLEGHLFQPRKRCMDCIRKHLLVIEALAEEAVTLAEADTDPKWVQAAEMYAEVARMSQVNVARGEDLVEIGRGWRTTRKTLVEKLHETGSPVLEHIDMTDEEASEYLSEMMGRTASIRVAAKHRNKIPGGVGDKAKPKDVDSAQLAKGIKVEMEHTDDKALAREIALDHLSEPGNENYYDELETIEKHARDLMSINDPAFNEFLRQLYGTYGLSTGPQRVAARYRLYSSLKMGAKYQKKKEVPKADGDGTTTVYEYSEGQVAHRNREKAKRIEKLRKNIGGLRTQVQKDLKSSDPNVRLTALAVALIDETYERVGNDGSAKDGHFGVTGWKVDHISFSGRKATLSYTGKSGVDHKKTVSDSKLVKALKAATKGKDKNETILCEGEDCRITATEVNAYLKEHDITAKDIRGLHANEEMKSELKKVRKGKLPEDKKEREKQLKAEFKKALEAAASSVGHEAATLKSQYLVPGLEESFMKDGTVPEKLDKTGHSKTAIIGLNNATDGDDPDDWEMRGLGGLISSLTYFEVAVVQDMNIHDAPIIGGEGNWTLRGHSVQDDVVMELCGAGYLEETDGEVRFSPLFDAKYWLYTGHRRERKANIRTAAYNILAHCPHCQGITNDGPRFWERCGDCSYEVAIVGMPWDDDPRGFGKPVEKLPGSDDWTLIPEADARLVLMAQQKLSRGQGMWIKDDRWAEIVAETTAYLERVGAAKPRSKTATKSDAEKEDEQAEKLIHKTPKKKPPRKDLHNRVMDDPDEEDDGDKKQDRRDQSQNHKDGSVMASWAALAIRVAEGPPPGEGTATHEEGDTWKPEGSDTWSAKGKDDKGKVVTQGKFESQDAAKAWLSGGAAPGEDEEGDKGKAEADIGEFTAEQFKALTEKDPKLNISEADFGEMVLELATDPEGPDDITSPEGIKAIRDALGARVKNEAIGAAVQEAEDAAKAVIGADNLPDDFRESLQERVSSLNPQELETFGKSYIETLNGLKEKPPKGKAAIAMARKAVGADVDSDKFDTEQVGELVAQALYADRIVMNPNMLGGKKLSDDTKPASEEEQAEEEDARYAKAVEAKDFYAEFDDDEIKQVIERLGEGPPPRSELPADSPRARQIDAIYQGIAMARILNDEEPPSLDGSGWVGAEGAPSPRVSAQFTQLAQAMGSLGEEDRLLGTISDITSPGAQEAVRDALSTMTDRELSEYIGGSSGGHPMASIADAMLARNDDGSYKLGDADRAELRKWIEDSVVDDIAFLNPLIGDYLEANGEKSTPKAVDKFRKKHTEDPMEEAYNAIKDWDSEDDEDDRPVPTEMDVPTGGDNEDRASTSSLMAMLQKASQNAREGVFAALDKFKTKPETDNESVAKAVRQEGTNRAIGQRKVKPNDKKVVKHQKGDVWGSASSWFAMTPDGNAVGPFIDRDKADSWASGEVESKLRRAAREKILADYNFTPWPELRRF